MTFTASEKVTTQVTMQVTTQVEELIKVFTGEHTRQDLQDKLNLANRENFRKNYLQSALDKGLIELTIPDKPNSSKQKYGAETFMSPFSEWISYTNYITKCAESLPKAFGIAYCNSLSRFSSGVNTDTYLKWL